MLVHVSNIQITNLSPYTSCRKPLRLSFLQLSNVYRILDHHEV